MHFMLSYYEEWPHRKINWSSLEVVWKPAVHLIKLNTGHPRLEMEEKEFLLFSPLPSRFTFFSRSVNNNPWPQDMGAEKGICSLRFLSIMAMPLCTLCTVYLKCTAQSLAQSRYLIHKLLMIRNVSDKNGALKGLLLSFQGENKGKTENL